MKTDDPADDLPERVDVSVALAFRPNVDDTYAFLWEEPYAELQAVRLDARQDDTIEGLCRRGAEALVPELHAKLSREPYQEYGFGFAHPLGRHRPPIYVDSVMLVDGDGRIIWDEGGFRSLTLRQLLRAERAGVLQGDPTHLALMTPQRGGGGAPLSWPDLIAVLEAAWHAASIVGTTHSAVEAMAWLRQRLRRGADALKPVAQVAQRQGSHPYLMERLLGQHSWHADRLGKVLGIGDEQAEAILELYGFERRSDGAWKPASDEVSIALRAIKRAAARAYADNPPDALALESLLVEEFESNVGDLSAVRLASMELPAAEASPAIENLETTTLPDDPVVVVVQLLAHIASRLDEIEIHLRKPA